MHLALQGRERRPGGDDEAWEAASEGVRRLLQKRRLPPVLSQGVQTHPFPSFRSSSFLSTQARGSGVSPQPFGMRSGLCSRRRKMPGYEIFPCLRK